MSTKIRYLTAAVAAAGLAAGATLTTAAATPSSGGLVKPQTPPATIKATKITPLHGVLAPGASVQPAASSPRAFWGASDGMAFYVKDGVTYPAVTRDGGRTWHTGPQLHVPAANAPADVNGVGAGPHGLFFAYAGPNGGTAVDVSSDGGKTWYQAFIGDQVASVVSGPNGTLTAFAQFPKGVDTQTTVVYRSTDGGRSWRVWAGIITG